MSENNQIEESHWYRDRQVAVYRRERSNRWQARFKLLAGGWHRFSTFKYNLKEAATFACDAYDESKFRARYDQPQISRRFDSIAKTAISAMQAELNAEMGKVVYHTYIAVIKLHLIPYFGHKYINNITPLDYKKFYESQELKIGKELTRSTINNYNSALNRIFDVAVESGWLGKTQVPELRNRGSDGERRPDFALDEYMLMLRRLREWVRKKDGKEVTRMIRELLRDYVLVLANTGMRPGNEINDLKWKHINWHIDRDGSKYIHIEMNSGKTGKRAIVGRHNVVKYLSRIQSRFPDLAVMTFDDLLKAKVDQYVFRLSNGKRTTGLAQNFEQFLTENKMLKDVHGQNRVLYSLRHSYATFALLKGNNISIHDLAVQMGTSVGMIEKHYSHLTALHRAKDLAGEKFTKKGLY